MWNNESVKSDDKEENEARTHQTNADILFVRRARICENEQNTRGDFITASE